MMVRKGGDYSIQARNYINALDLSDVLVDSRGPILYAMKKWLDHFYRCGKGPTSFWRRRIKQEVVLETPSNEFFASLSSELGSLGYEVISFVDALRRHGPENAKNLPMFVYERSNAETRHTIKVLKETDFVLEENVCALFPRHEGSDDDIDKKNNFAYHSICSTDIYTNLLRWVRFQALNGRRASDIQDMLDNDIGKILDSK